jgi:hypothetical protein
MFLISELDREKKATSEPEINPDKNNNVIKTED